MTDRSKPTPGTWRVDPNDRSCVITEALGVGDIVCLSPSEGGFEESAKHWEANAALIIEAGTAYHETGLTPRQLVEQRDDLLAALRMYIKAGFGNSTDYYAQSDAYNAAIKALRAPGESTADLIAKVEAKP